MTLRRFAIGCLLGLLFTASLPAQYLRTMILHNREYDPISDAEVWVNGNKAAVWNGYGHQIPDSLGPPFVIQVRHPDFLPMDFVAREDYLNELFLFRRGEDSIWYGRVWRPCLHTPDQLLVAGKEWDSKGNRLDPKLVRVNMQHVIAAKGYEIVREHQIWGMDQVDKPQKENMYLVQPTGGAHIADIAQEIARFRADTLVEFAGPAVLFEKDGDVLSFFPDMTVYFHGDADQQLVLSQWKAMGFQVGRVESGGMKYWSVAVRFDQGSLAQLNALCRKLLQVPGLMEFSPQVYDFVR